MAIDGGLAFAEQIEVGSVEDIDETTHSALQGLFEKFLRMLGSERFPIRMPRHGRV
jgi:hypothetical protein